MPENKREFAPVKKYIFPAGNLGGEIRVFIPATASKSDVEQMNRMLEVVAQDWKSLDEE